MGFKPDEEEPRLTIKLTNTQRAAEGDVQAGEGQLISETVKVRFENDDFTPETKQKLGAYLDCEIHDEAAQSQARIINKPPRISSLSDHNPNGISQAGDDSYMVSQNQTTQTAFEQTNNSKQFNFEISVKKNEAPSDDNEDPEARVLRTRLGTYSNYNEKGNESVVAKAVENLIDRNARFSPIEGNSPFINSNNPSEEEAGTGAHVFYSTPGTHPGQDFTLPSGLETGNEAEVTIDQLRNLGLRILIKSSGEAYVPRDRSTRELAKASNATFVTPGLARLGLRQRFNRFSATELLNDVNPDAVKNSVKIDLEGNSNSSYGNVNNPLVPFDAISTTTSSVIVSTLLTLTMAAVMQALAELFSIDIKVPNSITSNADPSRDDGFNYNESRKQRLGSFIPKQIQEQSPGANITNSIIDIDGFKNIAVNTEPFEYNQAVSRGLQVFFGLGDDFSGIFNGSTSIGGTVTNATSKVVESPGYWNTILRNMTRSVFDTVSIISNGIAGIGGGNINAAAFERTQYDIDKIVGPDGDPFAVLQIVDNIKDSRLFKFMNIIASIGNISLIADGEEVTLNANASAIDSIIDIISSVTKRTENTINPAALVKKNRLSDRVIEAGLPAGALAWGTSTLPSLYLQNESLEIADTTFNGNNLGTTTIILKLKKDLYRTDKKRIPQEEVQIIENELEAYYVPFYFHDLRTNEIIALHAFLENISDTISPEYAETQGYGRIGNVYTYKNTNRSISLSFKIISTNKEDFDQMWYKINKIAMFCFPQYTEGRQLGFQTDDGEYKFTQPFSQLPGSTPVIRMRIGDVFKTNFSEFELARLHGLGSAGFSTPKNQSLQNFIIEPKKLDRIVTIVNRQKEFNYNENESFIFKTTIEIPGIGYATPGQIGNILLTPISSIPGGEAGAVGAAAVASVTGLKNNDTIKPITIGANTKANIIKKVSNRIYDIKLQTDSIPNGQTSYRIDLTRVARGDSSHIDVNYSDIFSKNGVSLDFLGNANGGFDGNSKDINNNLGEKILEIQQFFTTQLNGGTSGNSTNNSNPIFQAFESTRGKGIPGVVKNISFDWNDAIWETDVLNSVAPKWITVQMEFAPIFEINPGIDINGNMIGALYNVGDIMNKLKTKRAQIQQQADDPEKARTIGSKNGALTKKTES